MPGEHEPTLGEVARRIDTYNESRANGEKQLRDAIAELRADMRQDRQHAADTYARKEQLDATKTLIDQQIDTVTRRVSDIEDDMEDKERSMRAMWLSIGASIIVMIIGALLFAAGLHPGGGS